MTVMIQIRDVPSEQHRKLKSRAAFAGQSLCDYLPDEIGRSAARQTFEEVRARISARAPVSTNVDPVDIIRELRDRE